MKLHSPLRLALLSLTALTLVLTACGAPADNTPTVEYSPSETTTAINEFQAVADGLVTGSLASGAQQAADSWPERFPEAAPEEAGQLLRGEYEWSESDGDWRFVRSSTNLVLRWSYLDDETDAHTAELTFVWSVGSPTVYVNVDDTTQEVPEDAKVTFSVDGTELGSGTMLATWQNVPECGLILEPASLRLTAYIGDSDGKLSLDELTVNIPLRTGTASTAGKVTGGSGEDELSFNWNLSAQTSVTRDPNSCAITDTEITSSHVELGVAANEDSLGIAFDANNFVFDDENDVVESVRISNGALRINGSVAVRFSGTLDANASGVPGGSLQLTFTDGTTMTLQDYLEQNFTRLVTLAKLGRALHR